MRNQWKASIGRAGIRTFLGLYDDELTAAVVYQVADEEYNKLSLYSKRGGRRTQDTCTENQPFALNQSAQALSDGG